MTTKRLAAIVIACCATIFAASAQQQMLTILMHVKEGFGNTYLDKGLTMTVTDAATGDTIMIPGADGKPFRLCLTLRNDMWDSTGLPVFILWT